MVSRSMGENQNEFQFQDTIGVQKIFDLEKRLRFISGGTSASKTIGILFWHIDYAQTRQNRRMDVMSETYPHLEDGAIKDFKAIMIDRKYWKDRNWNESKHQYTFATGTEIKFKSIDKLSKSKGPRRDTLFLNEVDNIPLEIYNQLEPRTKEVIWADFNPTSEFWYYTDIKGRVDHDFLKLTYLDCKNPITKQFVLDERIVQSIESRRDNKNWFRVYGEGELGEIETRIYSGWQMMDEVPFEARLERYGLDFGYTNDPSSIIAVYYYNGGYILDEKVYQKGLSNKEIADILKNLTKATVIADSAEPKSIDEIKSYGITILPAKKAKEKFGGIESYLKWSIGQVQAQKISVTKQSLNLIKEYRNYLWQRDKNDKILNEPEPGNDHALDAVRYAICSLAPMVSRAEYINSLPFLIKTDKPKNPAR